MISEDEARARVFAAIATLPIRRVVLADALDLFAAEDVTATIALPPFDNSAMDGYAVVARSATKGAQLRVIGEQPAGVSRNLQVAAGEAVRIFTGAPMPAAADAVVMQEETRRDGEFVSMEAEAIAAGDFVRIAGGDLCVGQKILRRGERLRAVTLGLLASQGLASVAVHERASVAIVTTGDELVGAGSELHIGQIFETNGVMLGALARRAGAAVMMQSHCHDDFAQLCGTLERGLTCDALVISGGVSVGEHDLVRAALHKLGVKLDLWRVRIKPGKPFLFGTHGRCAVFGLPGNPVSSFVTFLVFVRPALLRRMGAGDAEADLPVGSARLAHDVTGDETRPHYLRGRLDGALFATVGRQESHALWGLARTNALLRVAPGENLPPNSEVTVSLIQ